MLRALWALYAHFDIQTLDRFLSNFKIRVMYQALLPCCLRSGYRTSIFTIYLENNLIYEIDLDIFHSLVLRFQNYFWSLILQNTISSWVKWIMLTINRLFDLWNGFMAGRTSPIFDAFELRLVWLQTFKCNFSTIFRFRHEILVPSSFCENCSICTQKHERGIACLWIKPSQLLLSSAVEHKLPTFVLDLTACRDIGHECSEFFLTNWRSSFNKSLSYWYC